MSHVADYGGWLTSLANTLLSDIMNNDPQCVHHVHICGLATTFLDMIKKKRLVPSGDLVLYLPNVICALALTEEGTKRVKKANPFPALMSVFYNPDFIAAIHLTDKNLRDEDRMCLQVGSNLDEIARHAPTLKEEIVKSVVGALLEVEKIGRQLVEDEQSVNSSNTGVKSRALLLRRTQFVQFSTFLCHVIEQVVQKTEHR